MVKAFALHGVYVVAEAAKVSEDGRVLKAPRINQHQPGAVFDLDQDEFDELEAEGAVRKASKGEVAEAQAVAGASASGRARRSVQPTGSSEADPLDSMTKEQLLEEAKTRGVDVKPAQSKDEILSALKSPAE
ncbi:hypothetical protein [Microvirga zambiensis]|uniref:hypothetical protein n=1 Tax=Microvirga zambiensis TaxID=1402137 RepID=UPI00191E8781|nr:hypothetical protein [Microvirga zambiensis]